VDDDEFDASMNRFLAYTSQPTTEKDAIARPRMTSFARHGNWGRKLVWALAAVLPLPLLLGAVLGLMAMASPRAALLAMGSGRSLGSSGVSGGMHSGAASKKRRRNPVRPRSTR
jgi:hypothetical protein